MSEPVLAGRPQQTALEPYRPMLPPVQPSEGLALMEIWRILVKRRLLIAAVAGAVAITAAVYTFRQAPTYESVARLDIDPSRSANIGLKGLISDDPDITDNGNRFQTQVRILQSDSVMLDVARDRELVGRLLSPKFAAKLPSVDSPLSPEQREAVLRELHTRLTVAVIPTTQMVEIRSRHRDPEVATRIANSVVDAYIERDLQTRYQGTLRVSKWLERQVAELKTQASEAQRQLAEFQKSNNIVATDEHSTLVLETLRQMNQQMAAAEADRILKEARYRGFSAQDSDVVALMGQGALLPSLRAQLATLKSQQAELATRFGANYPKMRELQAQIAEVETTIASEINNTRRQAQEEYQTALRSETMLRGKLEQQKQEAYKLNEHVAQYAILRHEAESARELYDAVQMKLKEAGVTNGLGATQINIVDRAMVPAWPILPNKKLNLLIGVFGGLFLGVVVAFALEALDDTLPTSEEVENVSGLPSLATIPHLPLEKKKGNDALVPAHTSPSLVAFRKPRSLVAEAYRALRSSVLLSSIDSPPRVLVITSAFPAEGKSMTAANCAVTLAQRGARVLLVDADLRRGVLGEQFGLSQGKGLTSVLMGESDEAYQNPLPALANLTVIGKGPFAPNPAELLGSRRMTELLESWASEYDHVVLDTAPVLAISDTLPLASQADAVVLVVRAGKTRKRALVRMRDTLLRVNSNLIGVVVNDVDLRLENFYTYSSGYGYGYDDKGRKADGAAFSRGYTDDEA